jgi:hypothetical protein
VHSGFFGSLYARHGDRNERAFGSSGGKGADGVLYEMLAGLEMSWWVAAWGCDMLDLFCEAVPDEVRVNGTLGVVADNGGAASGVAACGERFVYVASRRCSLGSCEFDTGQLGIGARCRVRANRGSTGDELDRVCSVYLYRGDRIVPENSAQPLGVGERASARRARAECLACGGTGLATTPAASGFAGAAWCYRHEQLRER